MTSDDMLRLRSFMVCASTCAVWFNLLQPVPLIAPAAWGTFFICGHLIQIARILADRAEVEFTEDLADLYEFAFHPHGFRPRHFVNIVSAGRTEWVAEGDYLVKAGDDASDILLIWDGSADVIDPATGKAKGKLRKNRFIGNMVSSKGAHEWGTDVKAMTGCKIMRWKRSQLKKVLEGDKELISCVARMVATDLSRKLADSDQNRAIDEYRSMMKMAFIDGRLVPEEKKQLHEFRMKYHISAVEHVEVLEESGWTLSEFDNGAKYDKLCPENARRLSHFLDEHSHSVMDMPSAPLSPPPRRLDEKSKNPIQTNLGERLGGVTMASVSAIPAAAPDFLKEERLVMSAV